MKPSSGIAANSQANTNNATNYSKIPSQTNKAAGSNIMGSMNAPKRVTAPPNSGTTGANATMGSYQRADSRNKATGSGAASTSNGMMNGPSAVRPMQKLNSTVPSSLTL